MSILEYKQRLHELVESATDEALLEEAYRILSLKDTGNDKSDELSPDQLAGLEKARQEGRAGNFTSLSTFKQEVEEWLKKGL